MVQHITLCRRFREVLPEVFLCAIRPFDHHIAGADKHRLAGNEGKHQLRRFIAGFFYFPAYLGTVIAQRPGRLFHLGNGGVSVTAQAIGSAAFHFANKDLGVVLEVIHIALNLHPNLAGEYGRGKHQHHQARANGGKAL